MELINIIDFNFTTMKLLRYKPPINLLRHKNKNFRVEYLKSNQITLKNSSNP